MTACANKNKRLRLALPWPDYNTILFMFDLEECILQSHPLSQLVWWRFIDDIFMLWQHGGDTLKEFIQALNNLHPSIKFTAEYSMYKFNFLDVLLIKSGNYLITDLCVKPTRQYLYTS